MHIESIHICMLLQMEYMRHVDIDFTSGIKALIRTDFLVFVFCS